MSPQIRFTKFKEWKRELLEDRGLERPDGRPLYQYRLSRDEFDETEALLKHWLGLLSASVELAMLTRITGFPELFVLYASEWWRRRYDGSGFVWEPILRDLEVDPDGWSPGQRSACVEDGLREWGLEPRRGGGMRFLGAIAVQGGLPLRLLAEGRGAVGHLLHRVLELSDDTAVTQTQVQDWVESLRHWLPKVYRQDIIYTLLGDLVWAVLRLKRDAGLNAGDDAIAVLDHKVPEWRQRFPLSVEDGDARALVEQLVKDAAGVRIRQLKPGLPVQRGLERDAGGGWSLFSRIELDASLQREVLARLFGLPKEELPRAAHLSLQAGGRTLCTGIRLLAGHDRYRMDPADWQLRGTAAQQEHWLRLTVADGRSWSVEAHTGEPLDEELPWLFAGDDRSHGLLRQGAGKVAAASAFIALPSGWWVSPTDAGQIELQGQLDEPLRELFLIQGAADLHDPQGRTSRVRTGQAGIADDHLAWIGERVWLDFISPTRAYRGQPLLYRVDDEGDRREVAGSVACSVLGAPTCRQALGPVVLCYPASGDAQIRSRMLVLPKDAGLALNPGPAGGTIDFRCWGIATAKVVGAAAIAERVEHGDHSLSLQVTVADDVRAPECVDLELGWPHTTQAARLRLPFPASGVRAFTAGDKNLPSGSRLALSDLLGLRLVASMAGQQTRMSLQIGTAQGRYQRRYHLRTTAGALSLEIPLLEYRKDIEQLLSMDDSPDARAVVTIIANHNEAFRLELTRYSAKLNHDEQDLWLEGENLRRWEPDELGGLQVLATRLEFPADEPLSIPPGLSEGVATGSWRFEPANKDPGTWLIYPGPEAVVQFRPTLWPVAGDIESEDPLVQAIVTAHPGQRDQRLAEVIEALAADYLHPSWDGVEQFARQFEHLPLATLDLWRGFAHSPVAMAALALRLGNLPAGFFLRFAEQLPFVWEVIPLPAWRKGMACLREQCERQYHDVADVVFRNQLTDRKERLAAECGALDYLLGLASAAFDEQGARDMQGLKALGTTAAAQLFEDESSLLMALRRHHADDQHWPDEFGRLLREARKDLLISPFLYPRSLDFQDGVINLPLLAAAAAGYGRSQHYFSEPAAIHLLRTCRAFDLEWFDDAYNMTIARCAAAGACDD